MKITLLLIISLTLSTLTSQALTVLNAVILSETSLRLDAVANNASNNFTDADTTFELNVFIPGQELATTFATLSSNTFTAGTNNASLISAYIENYGKGYTNLFMEFDENPVFSTDSNPFVGSVVLSFAASSPADGNLPSPTQTNDIIESFTGFTVIGSYSVIPEPATNATAMGVLAGLLMLYLRRRRS